MVTISGSTRTTAWTSAHGSNSYVNVSASSVGLVAVRVAGAAARKRIGGSLNDSDRVAVRAAIEDLQEEAQILRGEQEADVDDEGAYAFAGFALSALSAENDQESDDDAAAARLDQLAADLERLMTDDQEPALLQRIEQVFLKASRIASRGLSSSGERLDGIPAGFRLR